MTAASTLVSRETFRVPYSRRSGIRTGWCIDARRRRRRQRWRRQFVHNERQHATRGKRPRDIRHGETRWPRKTIRPSVHLTASRCFVVADLYTNNGHAVSLFPVTCRVSFYYSYNSFARTLASDESAATAALSRKHSQLLSAFEVDVCTN